MKVLLLGGTGAIGIYLKNILSSAGHNVYITSRRNRPDEKHVTYILGNAHDMEFIQDVCSEKWNVIVDFMSYKTSEFQNRVNLLLTSTERYFFISSSRVYSQIDGLINEQTSRLLDVTTDEVYKQSDEYAITKALQEDTLFSSGYENFIIIRPYITYENYRLQLGVLEKEEWLYRALHGRTIVFPEEMRNKMTTLTSGYDVAMTINNIIADISVKGKSFHVTTNKALSWDEVFNIYKTAIQQSTGVEIRCEYVSTEKFLNTRRPDLKYQVLYDRMFDRMFDVSSIEKFVCVEQFVSPENGLKECLSFFLAKPQYKGIDWIMEGRKDKITHELTPLSEIPGLKNKILYIINRFK